MRFTYSILVSACLKEKKTRTLLSQLPCKNMVFKAKAQKSGLYKDLEIQKSLEKTLKTLDGEYKER